MRQQHAIADHYALRYEVHRLAEKAFHHHLISGYGDGEYPDKYQIVYQGKPRHFSLKEAYYFLDELVQELDTPEGFREI